MKVLNSLFH